MANPVTPNYAGVRRRLVETLQANGINDLAVLRAIDSVPRHLFVPTGVSHRAYEDSPIFIGRGQTISQPSVHARSLQALSLTGGEKVLEVGTGTGYQTALLGMLAAQVFSIERVPELMDGAREALREVGVRNVSFLQGDGTIGWREYAPYDGILVSAGGPEVPMPLLEQLAEGGRLVIPLGPREAQTLTLFTRHGDETERRELGAVTFVPLVGTHGWKK